MKFFNGASKRNSQLLIWAKFKKLFTPTHLPDKLKMEELERAVEERTLELKQANRELVLQNKERGQRAAEQVIANEELAFQNEEKSKRATELVALNAELQAFSYVSSHDLQEPLRKIIMLSNIQLVMVVGIIDSNKSEQGKCKACRYD